MNIETQPPKKACFADGGDFTKAACGAKPCLSAVNVEAYVTCPACQAELTARREKAQAAAQALAARATPKNGKKTK